MIGLITLVLVLQLVGEIGARMLQLPVPGPVIGMLLLLMTLVLRGGPPARLTRLANGLLAHLSLLFVPAGVGVIRYLDLLSEAWFAIGITLVASTLIGILTTAVLIRLLQRGNDPHDVGGEP